MTLFKKLMLCFFCLVITHARAAADINIAPYFTGKNACFLLYNLNTNKMVKEYNPTRCAQRISPYSSFKIALSLMAYDQHVITTNTVFKWDGEDKGRNEWNHDQTPQSWLTYSVVWVSQFLAPKIGMATIKNYLLKFNYGNQDFSGDPGKNNGLTKAWLGSSLTISADEQMQFLRALITNKLPVSQEALDNTKKAMFLDISDTGWTLYGKTGSGSIEDKNAIIRNEGWFEGYIQKKDQTYVFVTNFTDLEASTSLEPAAGTQAKEITKKILVAMEL